MPPFVIAHISDLHVSTFGDTFHDARRRVRRSSKPIAGAPPHDGALETSRLAVLWEEAGWRVLGERGKRKVRLIDPEGYEHNIPPPGRAGGALDALERAAFKACKLEARTARTLARAVPTPFALDHLTRATPNNANLRLLRAAAQLDPAKVDAVFVTGDLTDDGAGYELIRAAFHPWAVRGHLFVVPGNHDRYLFPLFGSERPRPTLEQKRQRYRAFEASLGLVADDTGLWHRYLPEADTFLVGLDSCLPKQPRFYRHNGAIGAAQLARLLALAETSDWQRARHRIVGLHHHVVSLPHGVGRAAPPEIGMRLDDAKAAAAAFDRIGVHLVLHGHRHVSEERKPAGARFRILASPSFTLGCRSGDGPSYWRIELEAHARIDRVHLSTDIAPPSASMAPPPAAAPQEEDGLYEGFGEDDLRGADLED
jgi:3',5'-cyclic AMP phosphodiesterase CpdA